MFFTAGVFTNDCMYMGRLRNHYSTPYHPVLLEGDLINEQCSKQNFFTLLFGHTAIDN